MVLLHKNNSAIRRAVKSRIKSVSSIKFVSFNFTTVIALCHSAALLYYWCCAVATEITYMYV